MCPQMPNAFRLSYKPFLFSLTWVTLLWIRATVGTQITVGCSSVSANVVPPPPILPLLKRQSLCSSESASDKYFVPLGMLMGLFMCFFAVTFFRSPYHI